MLIDPLAPDFGDSLGFVAGAGVTLIVVASIQDLSIGGLVPGVASGSVALASFVAVRRAAGRHQL